MKVVINACYGGFSLSNEAIKRYAEIQGLEWTETVHEVWGPEICIDDWHDRDIPRDDPTLIRLVEEMGEAANGEYARLTVIEIPDDVEWEIDEYDGNEHVAEKHRTWY